MVCKLPSNDARSGLHLMLKVVALSLALIFISCLEDLPPVEQPEDIQAVGVTFNVAGDRLVFLEGKDMPRGSLGALVVTVTNLFKEYMADDEQIEVEVRMFIKDHPERSAVVTLSRDELKTTGVLSHGVLAIAPNQMITMQKQWSHHTQEGVSFITHAISDGIEEVDVVTSSGKIFPAYPVHLMTQASIKVFKSRPTEYYPANRKMYKEFVLYYAR